MSKICFKTSGYEVEYDSETFAGDVRISRGASQVFIPFEVLKDIVADWVRRQYIWQLEHVDTDSLLLQKRENWPAIETSREYADRLEAMSMRDRNS